MKAALIALVALVLTGLALAALLRFAVPTKPEFLPRPTPPALDSAATHYATANRFYYEKLARRDSAARLRYLDSALATW